MIGIISEMKQGITEEMNIIEFQEKYPTKEAREEAIKHMTDEEIDDIIRSTSNIYAKIYYSRLKNRKHDTLKV